MSEKQGPSLTEPAPRWLVKVAIGMLAFIVVVTIVKLLVDDSSPSSTDESNAAATALTLPDAANAKCRVPNVEVLQAQSVAFEGTTTSIDGRLVTLNATHWYKGDPTESVTVEAATPQMLLALSGVEFEVGKHYLVTASDGQVTLCGFSAPYNSELADLYEQAYVS